MRDADDAAKAEELTRRRARMLPVLAVLFVGQQASYFSGGGGAPAGGPPGKVHIAAWFVLSIVILVALMTGGGWVYSRNVRRLANDESTRAHRDRAFRIGFISSMVACMVLYLVTLFLPLSGRDAVHAVLTVGILATLLCFAFLERRAYFGD